MHFRNMLSQSAWSFRINPFTASRHPFRPSPVVGARAATIVLSRPELRRQTPSTAGRAGLGS
jgi:hypothetical protein